MKVRISLDKPFALKSSPRPVRMAEPTKIAPVNRSFLSTLEDYADSRRIEPLRNQKVCRIPPPQAVQKKIAHAGLLSTLLSKLRSHGPGEKQLQLVETVQLGEKRFVAIINAGGRRFLVGGGTSGVSMLAQLDKQENSTEKVQSLPELTELAV